MTSRPAGRAPIGLMAAMAIAACARHQPRASTPVAASSPPAQTTTARQPGIRTVAFAGDVICALSHDGHLRLWGGSTRPAVALDLDHVQALSPDGRVAVTMRPEGDHGDRIDIWEPATRTRIGSRLFEAGIESVLGASHQAVALRGYIPPTRHPEPWVSGMTEPRFRGAVWNFAHGTMNDKNMVENAERAEISPDGLRLVFKPAADTVQFVDLSRGRTRFAKIAADWSEPGPVGPRFVPKPRPKPPDPWNVLSVRFDADGKDVYVTYRGISGRVGWRLERWTPNIDHPDGGSVTRLAATAEDGLAEVLAVSRDGHLVVQGHPLEPVSLRRAPRWTPQRLGADAATAAAVSADGKRIVSGHPDGRLRLWDARTGNLLATAEPQD
jgi:hypothetical protein